MGLPIDFGNGIIAGGSYLDDVRIIDHSGLDIPEVETAVLNNAVIDGGSIGNQRATTRRITMLLDFDNSDLTRREIIAAFTPSILRYLTSDIGTLPYYVEEVPRFESTNLHAPKRCSLTLISPDAYPSGEVESLTAEGAGLNYDDIGDDTAGTKRTGSAIPAAGPWRWIMQTFTMSDAGAISDAGFWFDGGLTVNGLELFLAPVYTDGGRDYIGELIATKTLTSGAQVLPFTGYHKLGLAAPEFVDAGDYVLGARWTHTNTSASFGAYSDTGASFADGYGAHGAGTYSGDFTTPTYHPRLEAGDGTDTTSDWRFVATVGLPSASSTTLIVGSDTEAPCDPVSTVTLGTEPTQIELSDGTNTLIVSGDFTLGDVVTFDMENRTIVDQNGTDLFGNMQQGSRFLRLGQGQTTITCDPAAELSVSWRPRYMGLI